MTIRVLLSDKFSKEIFALKEKGDFELVEKTGLSKDELIAEIGAFDCVLIRSATKLTSDILEHATNLKLIGRGGIGVDNVDIPFATTKNIKVMNTPFSNAESTAEHAIALMFAAAREIPYATSTMKNGVWDKKSLSEGRQLGGQTLGVIGAGTIGKIVASKALGLGMKVVMFDPYAKVDENGNITVPARGVLPELKVKSVTLDELLKASDFVTLHIPLTDGTKNLLNKDRFAIMKPNAILVNNARGGVVNEAELYDALKEKKILGAAFDVFEKEPLTDSPLLTLRNFISSPHISASTVEAQLQVATDLVNQVADFFNGKPSCILN
ncbi:hypothetical protein JXR93_02865 [bacterium]|nr:hypothetical protein [bacterium]